MKTATKNTVTKTTANNAATVATAKTTRKPRKAASVATSPAVKATAMKVEKKVASSQVTTTNTMLAPHLGDSVYIGFTSNGNGKIEKNSALTPFDKIEAIYSEKSLAKDGKTVIHTVRVSSGDTVQVIGCGKPHWNAIA